MSLVPVTVPKRTERSTRDASVDECVYEVEGILFRFDPALPRARASAWRNGRWQPITLTGEDVGKLVSPRRVPQQELAELLAQPGASRVT
jgi:hypothetical protein